MMKKRMHSLPGKDDITRIELANGMTILARPNFNSPSVVLSGYLMVGSLTDPDEKLGLANFTAAALMTGTAEHDFNSLHGAIESLGASLHFSSGTNITNFSSQCLAEDRFMICRAKLRSNWLRKRQPRNRKLRSVRNCWTTCGIGVWMSISVNTST